MEQPKKLKSIISDELKKQGLNVGEDMVATGAESIMKALPEIVNKVQNPTMKVILGIVSASIIGAKTVIMDAIDKIDGEDDAGRGTT